MVRPNSQADKPDRYNGAHHCGPPKQRFPRKNRNDFGEDGERGKDQDVHFRVAEYPKDVLPQNSGPAVLGIEEVRSQVPVQQQHNLTR